MSTLPVRLHFNSVMLRIHALMLMSLLLLLAWAPHAGAVMEITIIGGAAQKIPIAMVPFKGAANQPKPSLSEIAGDDLNRSGQFRLVNTTGGPQPSEPREIDFNLWRGKEAEAVVVGTVTPLAGGRFDVRFHLVDAVKHTQLAAFSYNISASQWRATAHEIADVIYEKLTGHKGAFGSRIAFVQKRGKRYELRVADADGENPRTMLRSNEPIISPVFSPDGNNLAYVSFEDKKPIVYTQSLRNGKRRSVAAFKGSNSAPAWSPDGRQLAVVLTRDKASQIYRINADGSGVVRLTQGGNIDTEPVFSPDGQTMYFTSDRGGSPQIYQIPTSGGSPKRVTFEGSYNVSPAISPDGKLLAFIRREGGRFQLTVQDLASGQTRTLTESVHDESPSFAPNGQAILYATLLGGQGVLGTVTIDGKTRARLSESGTNAREPAWGP